MGAPPKKLENFCAFIVAEVIIILISLLFCATFFNIPNNTSVFKLLSCASSIIIALYIYSYESLRLSLNNTPSVIYLITVYFDVQSSNLIEYPTLLPSYTPIYYETLFATLTAATLLGCVHPIVPYFQ